MSNNLESKGQQNNIPLEQQIAKIKQSVDNALNSLENSETYQQVPESLLTAKGIIEELNAICDQINEIENERNILFTLTDISAKLNSSLAIHSVLETVMDSIVQITGAERAFLMLYDDGKLEIRVGRNWSQENVHEGDMKISRSVVQQVLSSGEAVLTSNATEDPRFATQESVYTQHLRSILCAPLKLKGKVIGLIYADNRIRAGLFTNTQLNLMTSFSDQAAIAIENANLFDELIESNRQLENSYDSTLEGWATALELRDDETEGHTRRVTTLAVKLAEKMGFKDKELEAIRRGALLHDIGKMAIPDSILLNRQSLTDDETKIMRNHPFYAKKMLEPIEFLTSALDIPIYHHERWDGTGYPEGLVGEEIPLAARIFAIVDVYDALTSTRRYRSSLPKEEVLEMIKADSGTHFDPQVVTAFLEII